MTVKEIAGLSLLLLSGQSSIMASSVGWGMHVVGAVFIVAFALGWRIRANF